MADLVDGYRHEVELATGNPVAAVEIEREAAAEGDAGIRCRVAGGHQADGLGIGARRSDPVVVRVAVVVHVRDQTAGATGVVEGAVDEQLQVGRRLQVADGRGVFGRDGVGCQGPAKIRVRHVDERSRRRSQNARAQCRECDIDIDEDVVLDDLGPELAGFGKAIDDVLRRSGRGDEIELQALAVEAQRHVERRTALGRNV